MDQCSKHVIPPVVHVSSPRPAHALPIGLAALRPTVLTNQKHQTILTYMKTIHPH